MSKQRIFRTPPLRCLTTGLLYLICANLAFPVSTALAESIAVSGPDTVKEAPSVYQAYLHWMFFVTALIVVVVYWNRRLSAEIETRKTANHLAQSYLEIINRYVITSRTDLNGIIIDVSKAFCDISGYSRDELIGHRHGVIRHPQTDNKVYQELWETLGQGRSWTGEMCNRRKDGTTYWVSATIAADYDQHGKKIGYIAVHQDITDHRIVRELSLRDPLTGLYNRRHFNELFDKFLSCKLHYESQAGLILVDIDHFKKFNDTYGHQKGDTALAQVAFCLEEICIRLNKEAPSAQAHAFRLGGEEFALLALLDEKKTEDAAEMIRQQVFDLQLEHVNNEDFGVMTCSLGSYSFRVNSEHSNEVDELFRIADQALYRAKEQGRNQCQSANNQTADIELF
ncbi:PAS domain S-box-containing protein/diguanylate cyclase (GGDEF) domain-containing protein [Oceanospirillum linum]|nr:PAS domain S-box-containing protein/diguanylate cyclase (GGDEF) domain-containing protein [Oleiphilus messinensis]SMP06652.1 PAS domain S-box-containing protein/diguanylate cyclase (GGDEF) domain-containing protein [Oceanospirillum linum]